MFYGLDVVKVTRTLSFIYLMVSAIRVTVTWHAVYALALFIITVLITIMRHVRTRQDKSADFSISDLINGRYNPLKGKPPLDRSEADLPRDLLEKTYKQITELVIDYDPGNTESLEDFEIVKKHTECAFAKKARVWGSPAWRHGLSLENNIIGALPIFLKFSCLCQALGLDGFLFTIPREFGSEIKVFADTVRSVLTTISDSDPSGHRCMDKSYIDKRGWVFEFNTITMFVTTFAPFYPSTHSRFVFGSEKCFILFQPEISFAQHDLCPDTAETNWNDPKTIRDQIRRGFRDAGRPYLIRDTIYFPMVHDIVKPVEDDGTTVINWWKHS